VERRPPGPLKCKGKKKGGKKGDLPTKRKGPPPQSIVPRRRKWECSRHWKREKGEASSSDVKDRVFFSPREWNDREEGHTTRYRNEKRGTRNQFSERPTNGVRKTPKGHRAFREGKGEKGALGFFLGGKKRRETQTIFEEKNHIGWPQEERGKRNSSDQKRFLLQRNYRSANR